MTDEQRFNAIMIEIDKAIKKFKREGSKELKKNTDIILKEVRKEIMFSFQSIVNSTFETKFHEWYSDSFDLKSLHRSLTFLWKNELEPQFITNSGLLTFRENPEQYQKKFNDNAEDQMVLSDQFFALDDYDYLNQDNDYNNDLEEDATLSDFNEQYQTFDYEPTNKRFKIRVDEAYQKSTEAAIQNWNSYFPQLKQQLEHKYGVKI